MFGLSLGSQLIQDSAEKTWNCISQIANLLWYKFNNTREPIMPRQRRRSRSRSRSHSHDKSRDVKRRKIEVCESPNGPTKRSVSPEENRTQSSPKRKDQSTPEKHPKENVINIDSSDNDSNPAESSINGADNTSSKASQKSTAKNSEDDQVSTPKIKGKKKTADENTPVRGKTPRRMKRKAENDQNGEEEESSHTEKQPKEGSVSIDLSDVEELHEKDDEKCATDSDKASISGSDRQKAMESEDVEMTEVATPKSNSRNKSADETTPVTNITPRQMRRKLESEKKRQQKEKEREEKEKQKQEEKDKKEAEKLKKKEEKLKEIEQKQKEKEEKEEQKKREKEEKEELKKKEREEKEEQKRKEKEEKEELKNKEKEQKRLEKEKKEEQRRKEKEEERLRKQQEIDEKKQKEEEKKQKEEEKKQKAAAAFVSFFVPKKVNSEDKKPEKLVSAFMPFEVKSDMKLPPFRRKPLTLKEKDKLMELLERNSSEYSYLVDLKTAKIRSCAKTWPCQEMDDDVTVIEEEEILGETICEEKPKTERMRAKYLKFHENQRPAYYGTWRKKSSKITGRKPFGLEKIFDYEVESDDDWEEEEQGESLEVVSDDDKENEPENDDYEVDNEFFVPHGHLSDDEVDDEETSRLSPESQKQKLKLLKDAFEEDMKSKTQKIKPRSIGCIWYNEEGTNVDEAIDRYLNPLAVITNGQIEIKKRGVDTIGQKKKKPPPSQEIPEKLMPILLKLVHGSTIKKKSLVDEFLNFIRRDNEELELSKASVSKHIANIAQWVKNSEIKTKFCWMVNTDIAEKYSVELTLPNDWESVKNTGKTL